MRLVPDGYEGRFRYVGTVLESPQHGPQICAFQALSYPPQCSGPDVVGWSWEGLDATTVNRTTWGDYVLIGTWDGRLHLTEPPSRDDGTVRSPERFPDAPDLTTPCPPPEGGWRPVDPERTTTEAFEEAARAAATLPGFAGLWIDQPVGNDDPARMVMNVRFTGRLEAGERELRRIWGGALCVSAAERTKAELDDVQQDLWGLPGLASTGQDVAAGVVEAQVWVATQHAQRQLDRRYGAGVVRLSGLLEPVDL